MAKDGGEEAGRLTVGCIQETNVHQLNDHVHHQAQLKGKPEELATPCGHESSTLALNMVGITR